MADLTTLANVKTWIGIQTTGDDATLTRLVASVSAYIQSWLNRQILTASYTEVRNGTGTPSIALSNCPVQSVQSLTLNGVTIPQSPDGIAPGFVLHSGNMLSLVGIAYTSIFPMGLANVRIVYTAGFATTPPELEQAVIELIALRFRERTRIGEVSKSIGGEVVSFSQKDFPDGVRTILNNYKKVVSLR